MDGVNQLLYLQGVGADYTSYQGENVSFSDITRLSALSACGYDVANEKAINEANIELDVKPWFRLIPEQSWFKKDDKFFTIKIDNNFNKLKLVWRIYSDSELIVEGETLLDKLPEVGNYQYEGIHFSERKVSLESFNLAIGYYQLSAELIDSNHTSSEHKHNSSESISLEHSIPVTYKQQFMSKGELIVYPEKVYQPITKSSWGLSAQLYTLNSDNNFGIGDFNDLNELIRLSAIHGADYILLNPLHALFEDDVERASPYSPSDRLCLNPLYIHIQNSPDYLNNRQAQHLLESLLVKANIIKADENYLSYPTIFHAKYPLYLALFDYFLLENKLKNTKRYQEFTVFKQGNNDRITHYSQWLISRSKLLKEFSNLEFVSYLQWQAQVQLTQCQVLAKDSGMRLGIVNDLAVGCHKDGNEFKSNEKLFSTSANIGAPPDLWATSGQNWGLPAMDPVKIKQNGLQHFRELIRANMQSCGALRIDHVMGLMRLWWCISNENSPEEACYVYYPFEQMLAILKLESQLNQCAVIGEDLGVVPTEIKSALAQADIYTNSLFYFTKTTSNEFVAIENLPKHTLMMIANHDVPTFKAWWQQSDLNLRNTLKLFINEEQLELAQCERNKDKENVLAWLRFHQSTEQEITFDSSADIIYRLLVLTLAKSQSKLLTLQLDDLANEELPVNIPGTDQEYPNWRRRLNKQVTEIFKDKDFFTQINNSRRDK